MRTLPPSLMLLLTLALPTFAHGETYFQWRDAKGGLHLSNRADRSPATAARREVEHTPTALPRVLRRDLAPAPVPDQLRPPACPRADTRGVVNAVFQQLARTGRIHDLDTLLVAAEPVVVEPGSDLLVARRHGAGPLNVAWSAGDTLATQGTFTVVETPYVADELAERTAATEQAAVAYPAGDPCPTRPPLARYAVPVAHHAGRDVCDDYHRAFAAVGVTASRDRQVARSFRDVALEFAAVSRRHYRTDPDDRGPQLPAWIVDAHVAQVGELADETGALAEELAVALEEIDRAGRAHRCW